MVSGPFLLRRDRHLGFAIYKGNMNTKFTYVDENNAYVVARSSNEHNVSDSSSFINHASNYVQGPMQQNLHDYTSTTRKRAIDNMDTNGAPHMWCATTIY